MAIATSMAIGLGVAAAGSATSAVLGHKAATAQAKAAKEGTLSANALQQYMYNQNRSDLEPWRIAGTGAVNELAYLMGTSSGGRANATSDPQFGSLARNFGAEDFQKDPGYQFRLEEGQKLVERSAAARGGLLSGGTGKELQQYGQNFASNEYGNAFARFQENKNTRYNYLAGLAGLGQRGTEATVNAGQNYANQVGQNTMNGLTQAANARASGYGAIANGINGAGNGAMNWFLMNQMLGNNGNYGGGKG